MSEELIAYLDDILIYRRTEEEVIQQTCKVLDILQKEKLFVKLEKSEFEIQTTKFLGFIV